MNTKIDKALTNHIEIDTDRIMEDIRRTIAQRNIDNMSLSNILGHGTNGALATHSSSRGLIEPEQLILQPTFQPSDSGQYHVNDLLKYHDGNFVRNAYLAILRRAPDSAGYAHHLEHLRSGRANKIDILSSLCFSAEGKSTGIKIKGLKVPATIQRLRRLPLVGYFISLVIGLLRLPASIRHHARFEAYSLAQQQQIADHINRTHSQLIAYLQQLHTMSIEQRQRTEQMAQGQQLLSDEHKLLNDKYRSMAKEQEKTDASNALLRAEIERLKQQADALRQTIEEQDKQTSQNLQQTRAELVLQERRVSVLLEEARKRLSEDFAPQYLEVMASEDRHLLDGLYASFEDQFRGSREEIKERLKVYLPIIARESITSDVLDVGCGRGEWLEVLREQGVEGRGVDTNRITIERCRNYGLDVVETDALDYLRGVPDDSLRAVTSFHVIEHLPFETLVKFLDESIRTLKRGGLIILETPNPENFMVGSCNFYTDPTHRNPIPSVTLQFLLKARGINRTEIIKLRPWEAARLKGESEVITRFNEYFYGPPDYGIIGWKI